MPKVFRNPHIKSRKGLKIHFDNLKLELSNELKQMGYNSKIATVVHERVKEIDVYTIKLHNPYARLEKIAFAFARYAQQNDGIEIRYRCDFTDEEYQDFWKNNGKMIFEHEAAEKKRQSLRLWCR